jgi:hypothetical protein
MRIQGQRRRGGYLLSHVQAHVDHQRGVVGQRVWHSCMQLGDTNETIIHGQ